MKWRQTAPQSVSGARQRHESTTKAGPKQKAPTWPGRAATGTSRGCGERQHQRATETAPKRAMKDRTRKPAPRRKAPYYRGLPARCYGCLRSCWQAKVPQDLAHADGPKCRRAFHADRLKSRRALLTPTGQRAARLCRGFLGTPRICAVVYPASRPDHEPPHWPLKRVMNRFVRDARPAQHSP